MGLHYFGFHGQSVDIEYNISCQTTKMTPFEILYGHPHSQYEKIGFYVSTACNKNKR